METREQRAASAEALVAEQKSKLDHRERKVRSREAKTLAAEQQLEAWQAQLADQEAEVSLLGKRRAEQDRYSLRVREDLDSSAAEAKERLGQVQAQWSAGQQAGTMSDVTSPCSCVIGCWQLCTLGSSHAVRRAREEELNVDIDRRCMGFL